jgi:hypothetical protein
MARFIVRGSTGALPPGHVERFRSASGVTVVDQSPKMVLLEGEEGAIQRAVASMKDVTVHPEKTYTIPSPHPSLPKIKGPPRK